jgi:polyribonucleotide 5'-hydroxyl-kinase
MFMRIPVIHLQLVSGFAEIFGSELASNAEYCFQGKKLAIYTWHGCVLKLTGVASVEYVAGDTPMSVYLNAHMALQHLREQSKDHDIDGPRVMIVGPADVGKTSVCKVLLNYAGECSIST